MRSLEHFSLAVRNEIRGVFADIDATLTTNGRLTAYMTTRPCGAGFSELADLLLSAR